MIAALIFLVVVALIAVAGTSRVRSKRDRRWWVSSYVRLRAEGGVKGICGTSCITLCQKLRLLPTWESLPEYAKDIPADGTPATWWSEDGQTGFIGHWQGGELVQDREMTKIEKAGGGSAGSVLLYYVLFAAVALPMFALVDAQLGKTIGQAEGLILLFGVLGFLHFFVSPYFFANGRRDRDA